MAKTVNKGVKFLITGQTKEGKTTATTHLKDALVFHADTEKIYPLPHLHADVYPNGLFVRRNSKGEVINAIPPKAIEWKGVESFKKRVIDKLIAYKRKRGKLPKVVVFDTITKLYSMMVSHNNRTVKNSFGSLNLKITEDAQAINDIIESTLVARGIDVIILAHVIWNSDIGEYVIQAEGSKRLAGTGSFLGTVDYASFLWNDTDTRYISHKELAKPCRSLLKDIPDVEEADDFNLEEMLQAIRDAVPSSEYEI